MTLICKPKGRGNWHVYEITIRRKRREIDMFALKVGDEIRIGPWTLKVVEVRP